MANDATGDVGELLRAANNAPTTLLVMALGFDPRCLEGIKRFVTEIGVPRVVALSPQPPGELSGTRTRALREENGRRLEALLGGPPDVLPHPAVHDESSAGRNVAQSLTAVERLRDVKSVVFDVSSCPTSLAFPALAALLDICGAPGGPAELQVLVTQNSRLDGAIVKGSLGEAHPLAGFPAPRGLRQYGTPATVWVPVLGPGGGQGLELAGAAIAPQEVYPVLPFPAADPRTPDLVLSQHNELLAENYRVGRNNLIYAAEDNPFDLYRKLVAFDTDYQRVLGPVGGASVVLSMHGSKLLSIGALLAAFERRLGIRSVRANSYDFAPGQDIDRLGVGNELTCLWLRGAPYET